MSYLSLATSSLLCVLLFFLCSLEKGFALQRSNKDIDDDHSHHHVRLSSLLPSPTCSSSSVKGSNKMKTTLDVVHKHGPCSKLNKAKKGPTSHSEILNVDEERVKYINSKISKNKLGHDDELGLKQLDSATLPAKSGSLIGSGNYFVVVGLGTPKKDLSLLFDTGSDLTWTQCEPCAKSCYKQQDDIFDPSKSSTYSNITCTSSLCTQLSTATGNDPGCASTSKACVYGIQYGDSSFSVGFFSHERLTVTGTDYVDGFLFGCGQNNQGLFGGSAGLLGLGRHPISFVQQTAAKYHKIFSYCLPSTASNVGYLAFGASTTSSYVKYTPFSTNPAGASFYGLDITGISVGGTKLPVSSSTFSTGGTIIDSGTVITRLPPTAYTALRSAFRQGMARYPMASSLSILDTCYDLSAYKTVIFPKIIFEFAGGATVDLAAGTFYVASVKQVCLGFAPNGDDSDVTIFGNVQQKTLQVVYDVNGGKVGFGAGGCK